MVKRLFRRTRLVAHTATVILLTLMMVGFVAGPAPPSSSLIPISSYGIITLYGSVSMSGTVNVRIFTNSGGPFFVEKLLLLLQNPGQPDIVLNSISVDGIYTYSFNSYIAPRVVVVPTGTTIDDVVSALPTSLSFLFVKDPMGNNAVFASGGATNGLSFGIGYSTPLVGGGVNILALVLAPSNATATLTAA